MTPNEPKLRCGGPGTPGESTAAQGEGAAPAGLGGGAGAVTEPGKPGAAARKLTAMPAVTCSAWLGFFASASLSSSETFCSSWHFRSEISAGEGGSCLVKLIIRLLALDSGVFIFSVQFPGWLSA